MVSWSLAIKPLLLTGWNRGRDQITALEMSHKRTAVFLCVGHFEGMTSLSLPASAPWNVAIHFGPIPILGQSCTLWMTSYHNKYLDFQFRLSPTVHRIYRLTLILHREFANQSWFLVFDLVVSFFTISHLVFPASSFRAIGSQSYQTRHGEAPHAEVCS